MMDISDHLKNNGWDVIPHKGSLLALAEQFGLPVASRRDGSLVDFLKVIDKDDANPKSLSAIYGKDAFPFHTDVAYRSMPPKYIFMRMLSGSTSLRSTLVKDVAWILQKADWINILKFDLWTVSDGRRSFLSPILTFLNKGSIFRYDPVCMEPALKENNQSINLIKNIVEESQTVEIKWEPGNVLVLDNHRTLHARGAGPGGNCNENRIIERVLILKEE